MSAYLNVSVTVRNMDKIQEYAAKVAPIIASFGGEPVLRGRRVKTLNGEAEFDMHAVFRFPDIESVEAFWASDIYAQIVPLRNEGAEMSVTLLEDL